MYIKAAHSGFCNKKSFGQQGPANQVDLIYAPFPCSLPETADRTVARIT